MSKFSILDITNQDTTILTNGLQAVDDNSSVLDSIVDEIVQGCCGELDSYITYVKSILADDNLKSIPTPILEDITIFLPVILYQVSDAQEHMGIKEDIAKSTKLEVYNNAFNNANGTVNDKKAIAELQCQSESVVHTIYQRCYKIVKSRMDLGLELLQSVKKVLSKRITELELSRTSNI